MNHEVDLPLEHVYMNVSWSEANDYHLTDPLRGWLDYNIGRIREDWYPSIDCREYVHLNVTILFRDKAKAALFKLFWG
jgi:hypothetical protein